MTLKNSIWVVLSIVAQLLLVSVVWAGSQKDLASYQVAGIEVTNNDTTFLVKIEGKTPPTYTVYELFDPLRVVVDIADASFGSDVTLPLTYTDGPVSKIIGTVLTEKKPSIAKVEILLDLDWPYAAKREGDNIQIAFTAPGNKTEPKAKEVVATVDSAIISPKTTKKVVSKPADHKVKMREAPMVTATEDAAPHKDLVSDLLDSISAPVEEVSQKQSSLIAGDDDKFAAAGYKKKKISVDFYKINLHNVFRLFGEISGANMIIDEGVSGSLTLALNEVPWDFAMDIILNLKGLQKEERFNTIVISPSTKAFSWPEEPEKALEIKAPHSDIKISIEQRLEMPKGMLEAKKLMRKAQKIEEGGNNKMALELYEEAFLKWPDNGALARRIASFSLVKMGMNAKALHYAHAALKLDDKDYKAALQAAVAAANMKKPEAASYFKLAISQEIPSQEALSSYSSYAEQQGDFSSALSALTRAAGIYGDSLDTMIARARIFDRDGQKENATAEYRAILFSGYGLDNDLKRYIKGRVVLE